MQKLLVIGCFAGLLFVIGCKPKVKSQSDKKYEKYKEYERIYSGYGKLPADSTIAQLNDFLDQFPEDARAWAFYARLMHDKGNTEKALEAYKTTIALNPRYTMGYSGAGSIYNQLNQLDSANFYLSKAVELHDSSSYTFLNLAMVCQKLGKKELAEAYVDSTVLTGDSSAAVFAGLSFVQRKLGNSAESELFFDIAKELGLSDSASFKDVLAGRLLIDSFYRKNNY